MAPHHRLKKDLLRIAKEAVRKRGRRLSWLRFAQRRPPEADAFEFILHTEAPWDVLHEIVEKTASLNTEYAFAVVVDIASDFFNSDDAELLKEEDLQVAM